MNKSLNYLFALLILAFTACQKDQKLSENINSTTFPTRAKDMNIYEVNIRQYTPEGTLEAFIPHLDRLKNMGVDILWIMPVQPIGEKNRKEPLGSYYSISDYTAVNPQFGDLTDFEALVNQAHEKEMLVILDWVANHTAYDHHWAEEHPEYYNLDSLGNLQSPVADWTDVADLNYDNPELHQAMMQEMKWWVTETNVDGFRCDVAGMVPNEFWSMAIDSLQATKDVFMLAEWDEPKMHEAGFHMTYGWEFHHLLNDLAKGKANADSVFNYLERDYMKYDSSAFRMYFTSNHDENTWNGTVFERMGEGYEAMAVLASTIQGMPLIYGGQEAGLDKRLPFFDKDSIDWSDLEYQDFYQRLLSLKSNNPALWNGEFGARALRVKNASKSTEILAFSRKKDTNEVLVILNLSDSAQSFQTEPQYFGITYKNVFADNNAIEFSRENGPIELDSWSYLVLTNNKSN